MSVSWLMHKPVIGMIHVPAMPGAPRFNGNTKELFEKTRADALNLVEGGVNAVLIENQFDTPYLKDREIGPETVAMLTAVAYSVRDCIPKVPLGINVHLNGAIQALAIAKAVGAQFIRCFNLMNAYISNSGYIDALGPQLMRYRKQIDAQEIDILGDFQVKHGSHSITADRSFAEKAHDIYICGGSAAILTGSATGIAPKSSEVSEVKKHCPLPVIIGSGLNSSNLSELWPVADGAIIGSGFKQNGNLENAIDINLVKEFMLRL